MNNDNNNNNKDLTTFTMEELKKEIAAREELEKEIVAREYWPENENIVEFATCTQKSLGKAFTITLDRVDKLHYGFMKFHLFTDTREEAVLLSGEIIRRLNRQP